MARDGVLAKRSASHRSTTIKSILGPVWWATSQCRCRPWSIPGSVALAMIRRLTSRRIGANGGHFECLEAL